ncbi:MAG: glycine zipper 2TM domain-containing protein, partial [Burkholderiales bacterium]
MPKTHPLIIVASIAVIIFSLIGVAAITGLIPGASSKITNAPQSTPSNKPFVSSVVPLDAKKTPARAGAAKSCPDCGVIESITAREAKGDATGIGLVAGGVAGGLLGNQVGRGTGNTVATVAGAAGGAYAGHEIEKNVNKKQFYQIRVRMDNG